MEFDKLLVLAGFNHDSKPLFVYSTGDQFIEYEIKYDQDITLEFDTDQRFCVGNFDIKNGDRFVCPDKIKLEPKYEQCQSCQAKTGFNPAFYNADSVSEVQQEMNSMPHFLYIAYFSDTDIKVGISNARRGDKRLLEQGARDAIILETFNSAMVARKYEAQIARLPFMCENVKLNRKINLLANDYDKKQAQTKLMEIKKQIEQELKTEFKDFKTFDGDPYFFSSDFNPNDLREVVSVQDQAKIAGKIVAVVGTLIICQYDDYLLALPLKKFTGYKFRLSHTINTKIELNAQQSSLF